MILVDVSGVEMMTIMLQYDVMNLMAGVVGGEGDCEVCIGTVQ